MSFSHSGVLLIRITCRPAPRSSHSASPSWSQVVRCSLYWERHLSVDWNSTCVPCPTDLSHSSALLNFLRTRDLLEIVDTSRIQESNIFGNNPTYLRLSLRQHPYRALIGSNPPCSSLSLTMTFLVRFLRGMQCPSGIGPSLTMKDPVLIQ